MKCYDDQEEILQIMKIVKRITKQAAMKNKKNNGEYDDDTHSVLIVASFSFSGLDSTVDGG